MNNMEELFNQVGSFKERLRQKKVKTGNQKIVITINGTQEVQNVVVDYSYLNKVSPNEMEDLIADALNRAIKDSQEIAKKELSEAMGGIPIPEFFEQML